MKVQIKPLKLAVVAEVALRIHGGQRTRCSQASSHERGVGRVASKIQGGSKLREKLSDVNRGVVDRSYTNTGADC